MGARNEVCARAMRLGWRDIGVSGLVLSASCASLCLALGCAAPGDPTPKRPPVPEGVTDLAVRQAGDSVVLTFTLPNKTTEDEPLTGAPTVEIYRSPRPAGAPPEKPAQPAHTIMAAAVPTYVAQGQMKFIDPLKPEEIAAGHGKQMVYVVRTRVSKRRASADSNLATLRVYPVPERIVDLRVAVSEAAMELAWSSPSRTTGGAPLTSLAGYRIYRAEVAAEQAAGKQAERIGFAAAELLDTTQSSAYRDTKFEFGRTYVYTVRSVAQYDSETVESADSSPVVVTPRDVFPPAPPKGLVAVPLPETPESPPQVDLSWGISAEPDLAGYHIYRRDEADLNASTPRQRLDSELLLTPTFRDTSVQSGRRYTYRVSAVDRAGNESAPSDAVSIEVPLPDNPAR